MLKLDEDIKNIKPSKKMFISADTTQNFYEIKNKDHEKILYKNVTKIYKKTIPLLPKKINVEAKMIAKELNPDGKLDITAKQVVYRVGADSKRWMKKIEISSFKNFRVLKKGIFYLNCTKKIICKILTI